MAIYINPGTGGVTNANEKNAVDNIKHFITDLNLTNIKYTRFSELDYGEGRYCFILFDLERNRCCEIQMPGLTLGNVRYVDSSTQNIWNFPRLYVDGSSWVWCYAIDSAVYSLTGEEDEQQA